MGDLDDALEQIKRTISMELRRAGLTSEPQPCLPPPCAFEAEKAVLGAVISAEISISELGNLHADHFSIGLHRWIYQQIQGGCEPTAEALVSAAETQQIGGIKEDLEDLRWQPFQLPEFVRVSSEKIIRAAQARTLIEGLQRAELALRTGVRTPEQVVRYLKGLAIQ